MSRGPGRIECGIRQLMADEPDGAWTVEDIAEKLYSTTGVEKKHRVSVIRALNRITKNDPDWTLWQSACRGSTWVLANQGNLQSYALAHLKCDNIQSYRGKGFGFGNSTEADLKKVIAPGGRWPEWVEPGSDWWCQVQIHIARRVIDN